MSFRKGIVVLAALLLVSGRDLHSAEEIPGDRTLYHLDAADDGEASLKKLIRRGGAPTAKGGDGILRDLERYHLEVIASLTRRLGTAVREYVRDKMANDHFLISGNIAGLQQNGRWPEVAMAFDYLNNEMDIVRATRFPGEFLEFRALTEAVGTGLMVMPDATANKSFFKKEDPALYARATGLAYASGAYMHIPWCLYDGSEYDRYYGSLQTHVPIFQMISKNRGFFDGYASPLWNVLKVPYGEDGVTDQAGLSALVGRLYDQGVPTAICLEDQKGRVPQRLDLSQAHSSGTAADAPPAPLFTWNAAYASAFLPPLARVSGESSVKPLVIHVIARGDAVQAPDAEFSIDAGGLKLGEAASVKFITIGDDVPVDVKFTQKDGRLTISMPAVKEWGVFQVGTKSADRLASVPAEEFHKSVAGSEIPVMRLVRFDRQWKRPAWVDEALKGKTDPMKLYGVTRVTWSYDDKPRTIDFARKNDWAYTGSIDLGMLTILPEEAGGSDKRSVSTNPASLRQPADWKGWARDMDGNILLMRPDFNPPRFATSFASDDFFNSMLDSNKAWIDLGVNGMQWDDVSAPLNRVWLQGGDTSDDSLRGFVAYLQKKGDAIPDGGGGVAAVRKLLAAARQGASPVRFVRLMGNPDPPYIEIPLNSRSDSRGRLLLCTIPFERTEGIVDVDVSYRLEDGGSQAAFTLMDAVGATYYNKVDVSTRDARVPSAAGAAPVPLPQAGEPVWRKLQLRMDPATSRLWINTGGDAGWQGPFPFEQGIPAAARHLSFGILLDPAKGGFALRNITVKSSPGNSIQP